MASAAVFEETKEKCNGTKLARLLIDGGTDTLRRVFDSFHSPAILQANLHKNKPTLQKLLKKKILKQSQWEKLYPPSGSVPDSKTFDISLLFTLLRNVCGLTAPSTGWNALPHQADTSLEANLTRIKYYRNQVYGHVTSTGLSDAVFEQNWKDVSSALVALGCNQVDIDLLKLNTVGENNYVTLLTTWKLEEDELKEVVHELKEEVYGLKVNIEKHISTKSSFITDNLTKCNFSLHTKSLVECYQKGTRQWVLDKVNSFYTNPEADSRALMITSSPGIGKTVLAAVISENAHDDGCLAACHFIEHNNSQRNNPRILIQSIAKHLCDNVKGFEEKLNNFLLSLQPNIGKSLSEMNIETLFTVLLEDPLSKLERGGLAKENILFIVIDALDELESATREEFINILLKKVRALPQWLKLVVTSRPMERFLEHNGLAVINIEDTERNNIKDIKLFLSEQIKRLYSSEPSRSREDAVANLTEASQGSFLFAHFVVESAKQRSLSEITDCFPKGIDSVYEEYFNRLQTDLQQDSTGFANFLRSYISAMAPLPCSLVLEILGINEQSRSESVMAAKALKTLNLLFPIKQGCFSIFNKSFADWLTAPYYGHHCHDFSVTVADGHRVLAEHCLEHILRIIKSNKNFCKNDELNDCEKYALSFGFHHMLEAGVYEEQLKKLVQDLDVLALMWIASEATTPTKPWERVIYLVNVLEHINKFYKLAGEDLPNLCKVMKTSYTPIDTDCQNFLLQCAAYCPPTSGFCSNAAKRLSFSRKPWIQKQKLYSFDEDLYVHYCSTGEHIFGCICFNSKNVGLYLRSPCKCTLMTLKIGSEGAKVLSSIDLEIFINPCIKISPGDKYVAVYEEFGTQLQLRDLRTLGLQHTFKTEFPNFLLSCCFLSQVRMSVGFCDGTVRVWNVEDGIVEKILQCSTGKPMNCMASITGQLMTVQIGPFSVLLWRLEFPSGNVQLESGICQSSTLTSCASFSPDGSLVAFLCSDGSDIGYDLENHVKIFDVQSAKLQKDLFIFDKVVCPSIMFIDNTHLLIYDNFQMKAIDISDGSMENLFPEPLLFYYKGISECVAIDYNHRNSLYKLTFHNLNK